MTDERLFLLPAACSDRVAGVHEAAARRNRGLATATLLPVGCR
jgi:hypothetical protein